MRDLFVARAREHSLEVTELVMPALAEADEAPQLVKRNCQDCFKIFWVWNAVTQSLLFIAVPFWVIVVYIGVLGCSDENIVGCRSYAKVLTRSSSM